ncbi:MAG TPA: low affinity iron permease family protein [Vicinamibacteria bacterium]
MSKRRSNPAERLAIAATRFTGRGAAFAIALALVVLWIATGPLFHYSNTWQLVVNTGTTVVTFLMVFLIQRTQNKEALAMQLKLNEIVAALEGASNRLVSIEDISEKELVALHAHYTKLAEMAKRDIDLLKSHSIDEAEARHQLKLHSRG